MPSVPKAAPEEVGVLGMIGIGLMFLFGAATGSLK